MAVDTKKAKAKPAARATLPKGEAARRRIVKVAQKLFTRHGFEGASMRDIAAAAKLQPASVYHHFASKEELLWAVWEHGGIVVRKRLREAIAGASDPWERLRLASIAHIEGLLDWERANQVLFVMPPWQYPPGIRDRVVALRDEYEAIFVELLEDLPLADGVDRNQLRLALLGALSWPLFWYKPERGGPDAFAENVVAMLRRGVEPPARRRGRA
jgi:AcrR family transcriptional regulator